MKAFIRLANEIINNEYLEEVDRLVVKQLVYRLKLDLSQFEEVNEKIKGQMELEADLVYLLSKYRKLTDERKFELEEQEAEVLLDVPHRNPDGYKTGAKEFRAHQLLDPNVAVERRRNSLAAALYHDLQNLSAMVFGRNKKLNELSVNYRKEMAADH